MADKNLNIKVKADVSELTKLRREVTQTGSEFLKAKNSGKATADEMNRLGNAFKNAQGRLIDAKSALKEVGQTAKMSRAQLLEFGENLTVVSAGVAAAFSKIKTSVTSYIDEANKLQAAQLGLQGIATFKGIDKNDAVAAVQNLELVKNGLITVGDASLALKNLLASGFSLNESIDLIKGFGDSAAFGRQSSLEFGYAIASATEGIKNQNSILVDNAGVTKNLSLILKEAGFSEKDLGNVTTDASVRRALYNGLLKETTAFTGDAAKLTETFAGKQAKLSAQVTELKQKFGGFTQDALNPLITKLVEASDTTKTLAGGVFEIGGAFTAILPAIASAKFAFQGFSASALGALAPIAAAVAGLASGLAYITSKTGLIFGSGVFDPSTIMRNLVEGDVQDKIDANELTKNRITDALVDDAIKKIQSKKNALNNVSKDVKTPKVSKGGSAKQQIQEITNEIVDLGKQIADLEAKLAITDAGTTLFSKYTSDIKELQKQLDFLKLSLSDLTKVTSGPASVTGLQSGIAPVVPDELLQFRLDIQAQDEEKARRQQAIDDTQTVYSEITNILSVLNIGTETFVGKLLSGLDSAVTIIKSLQTINSILSIIPGFASGGVAAAGMPYMAGERGTELIFPQTNHTVLNHSDTMRYLNSNSNGQVNVYLSSNVNQRYLDVGIEKHNSEKNYIKVSKR